RPIMHKNWDWEFVVGAKAGRKPAIQRPKPHQWYYCNPKYSAEDPLPTKIFPPHAPPTAESLDDWAKFRKLCPKDPVEAKKFRKHFVRFLNQRNYDWRTAFERGLAKEVAVAKAAQRAEDETKRQEAWHAYRTAVFESAL
uniref:mL87 n=1 Tax=Polytomella magna TaxID=353565 RepID=UPI002240E436|nr:Chain AK, mL87 [Polytomella magna]8APN_AK Chain AK, mL87 [Polytomella magna]8APO_AK Chain AK, mL87 [Polytomella magna]